MPDSRNISAPSNQGFVLPLEPLLDELQQAGFARDRLGYVTRMRVQELLNHLSGQLAPEALKFKLAALICQSEEEQQTFYEIFDGLVSRFYIAEIQEVKQEKSEKKPERPQPEKPVIPDKPETTPVAPKPEKRQESIKAGRSGPIAIELKFRDDGYRPWNLAGMEAVVRPLREKEPVGAEEWDIPKTIDQTIRSGGVPQFRRKRRKQAPQYLLLIEQKSARDHLAGLYADLAQELARRDVDADWYFYSRVPEQCWKDRRDPASYTNIERLHAEFPSTRLILIGEPDGLLAIESRPKDSGDKFIAKVLLYPSPLAFRLQEAWPAVALLNTRSTADWAGPEEALHRLFPVAPATLKGLGSLMEQWASRLSFRPYFWKTEQPEPAPPSFQSADLEPETIRKNIKNLKIYLGRQGYSWLCAIAVYPEIYWQLTKILHDEAISTTDVPDESLRTELWHINLLRLCRLDWLRRGYIPAEYRQELRNDLPKDNAIEVRRQLLEVLGLEENKPPKDSYAEKSRIYTLALYDHERYMLNEQPDPVREAALREKLQEKLQSQGVAVSDIEDAIDRSFFENLPQVPTETVRNFWVLWVDDNPGNNTGFQQEVTQAEPSLQFVNALNTQDALKALKEQHFDLVISDVSRHGIKDAGIKMMLRFKEEGIALPIIIFTHPNYVTEHRNKLIGLGAVEVISGFQQLRPVFYEQLRKKRAENERNLQNIQFLEEAKVAAKAVCRVILPNGELTTGMLTPGNYLFTVAHQVQSQELIADAMAEFNFEKDDQGRSLPATRYRLDPSDVIFSPPADLDFIRIKLIDKPEAPLSQWGYIEFETAIMPLEGESLCLIHHAEGKEKQTELNTAIAAEGKYLHYNENSAGIPGASGAPVLNRNLRAVAMHHARRDSLLIGGRTRTQVREGILMREIAAFIDKTRGKTEPASLPVSLEEILLTVAAGRIEDAFQMLLGGFPNAFQVAAIVSQWTQNKRDYHVALISREENKQAQQRLIADFLALAKNLLILSAQPPAYSRREIVAMIGSGNIEDALSQLVAATYDSNVAALSAAFHVLKKENMQGLITMEQFDREASGIVMQTLQFIGVLQPETTTSYERVKLLELIGQGKPQEVLELLQKLLEENSEVITLKYRFTRLKNDELQGVISPEEAEIRYARLTNELLELTRKLTRNTSEYGKSGNNAVDSARIKTLIEAGEVMQAAQLLTEQAPDLEEAYLLLGRSNRLTEALKQGAISFENFNLGQASIANSLRALVDQLEPDRETPLSEPVAAGQVFATVLRLIARQNKLPESIEILRQYPEQSAVLEAISDRWEKAENNLARGLVDYFEYSLQTAGIAHDLLSLAEQISAGYTAPAAAPPADWASSAGIARELISKSEDQQALLMLLELFPENKLLAVLAQQTLEVQSIYASGRLDFKDYQRKSASIRIGIADFINAVEKQRSQPTTSPASDANMLETAREFIKEGQLAQAIDLLRTGGASRTALNETALQLDSLERDRMIGRINLREYNQSLSATRTQVISLIESLDSSAETSMRAYSMEEMARIRESSRDEIAKGNTKEAIEYMLTRFPNNPELLALSGQFNTVKNQYQLGILAFSDRSIEESKINAALLNAIDRLTNPPVSS